MDWIGSPDGVRYRAPYEKGPISPSEELLPGEWVIPLLRFELGEVSLSERQCTSQIGLSLTSHLTLPTGHYCWAQYACIMQFTRKTYFISGFHFEFLAKEESLELLWPNYCFVLKRGSAGQDIRATKENPKLFKSAQPVGKQFIRPL